MSEASTPQSLFDSVAARLQAELARQSEKAVMREASLPRSLINRARSGIAPGRSAKLLWALKRLGPRAALKILEPVLGPVQGDEPLLFQCIDNLERLIGEYRHARSSRATAAPEASCVVPGGGGADDVRARLAGGPDRRLLADQIGAGGPQGQAPDGSLSLVSTRRPVETIERLRPLLGNVYSLDAARRLKAQHRNLGVAYREKGGDWLVDPAEGNRLWRGSTGPRPLLLFPSKDYAETVRGGFEEAVASPEPIALEHTGYLDGEHIHALIGRRGWVDADGVEVCVAAFERMSA